VRYKATIAWIGENLVAPVVSGIASAVAILALVFYFGARVAESVGRPSCTNPRDSIELKPNQVRVHASSQAVPPSGYSWSPQNLIDGDTDTHWVPRVVQAHAGRAFMKFTFSREQDLQLICVVNGDAPPTRSHTFEPTGLGQRM
jgi:hypothetical protein